MKASAPAAAATPPPQVSVKACSNSGMTLLSSEVPSSEQKPPPTAVPQSTSSQGLPADQAASEPSLEPQPGEVWYLAFGSNMNSRVLTGRRKVVPLASHACTVPGYCLGFNYRGIPYLEPGFATILPVNEEAKAAAVSQLPSVSKGLISSTPSAPSTTSQEVKQGGGSVSTALNTQATELTGVEAHVRAAAMGLHGVAHLVSEADWEEIKRTEGVAVKGLGYQVIQVKCELYGGGWITAYTLMAAVSILGPAGSILPSERYIKILREGAREHGIEPEYCALLDAQPHFAKEGGYLKALARLFVTSIILGGALVAAPLSLLLSVVVKFNNILGIRGQVQKDSARKELIKKRADAIAKARAGTPANNGAAATNGEATDSAATVKSSRKKRADPAVADSALKQAEKNALNPGMNPRVSLGRRMAVLRQAFNHPIMTYFLFMMTSLTWRLHDAILSPVLGSGCNNSKSKVW